jgi:glyoxylase-like metal-dependent hydrolase (beta-lactamase superfamily II)
MDHLPNTITLSVGTYEVYVLRDGIYRMPSHHIMHARGDAARQAAYDRWGKAELVFDVNCFALSGPGGLTLIDTGAGDMDGPDCGNAALALRDAGFRPEDVTNILLTHLHSDHFGGLFDGEAARFPNAIVHIPLAEMPGQQGGSAAEKAWAQKCGPRLERIRSAYGDRLRSFGFGPALPGIDAVALPGHTPGHSGFLVHDDRRSLLIWGDIVHVQGLQLADPEVGMDYDIDTAAALHSSMRAMQTAAREGWYVAGSHIVGIHHITELDGGFALVQA